MCTLTGCEYFPEGMFKLASESRLPKWVSLPFGVNRNQVLVIMDYYLDPFGPDTKVALRDGSRVLFEIKGKIRCDEPLHIKSSNPGILSRSPEYEAITINQRTEIIEHKASSPFFALTDDPLVWKQYLSHGCTR